MDGFANDKPLNTQKMDSNADGRLEMDEWWNKMDGHIMSGWIYK